MLPLLRLVATGDRHISEATEALANEFALSKEERDEMLPSGKQRKVHNRVHWAGSYLVQAGLLERPKRGVLRITDRGRSVLRDPPAHIDNTFLSTFSEFQQFKSRTREEGGASDQRSTALPVAAQTPEERIEAAHSEMNAALRKDLLERILKSSPEFFELLIIDLMLAMGYGAAGGGQHLGRSNDGGVDGVISEDALGLDVVFLQAKRYQESNSIGIDRIQAFIGALVGQGANKGVFVTTSYFTAQARDYAKRTPQRLILIDGEELTKLLIRYKVGVRSTRQIDFMRIDADYFDDVDQG